MKRAPRTRAPAPAPADSAAARLAASLGDRLRRDVAWVALLCGLTVAAAADDPLAGAPQALAAIALLLFGARAEVLRLGMLGRGVTLLLCGAVSWSLSPEPRALLAAFLGLVTATTLLQPKGPRELGLVLATGLLQTALAAVLSVHPLAFGVGLLFVFLSHAALGTFHRLRAARRVAGAGGVVVHAASDRVTTASGRLAATAVLAVSLPIFVVLPRAQIPFLSLTPAGLSTQTVGDEMRLGGNPLPREGGEPIGTLAPKNAAAEEREPYLRVEALDELADDGARWHAGAGGGDATERLEPSTATATFSWPRSGEPAVFDVDFHGGAAMSLPVPEGVHAITFREPIPERVDATRSGSLKLSPRKSVARLLFTVHAGPLEAHAGFQRLSPNEQKALKVVPPNLARDLRPILAEAIAGKGTPRDVAFALEAWIRARCEYSLTRSPRGSSRPIVDFLTRTRSGHCEWFAAALATSLRVAGIPARVVSGYYASRWNELGSRFWVVRRRDAHAWVEAYVDDGWVRLDATPSAGREPDPYEGILGLLARVRDAASFEWSRRVLAFDREAQRRSFEQVAATIAGAWQGAGQRGAPVLAVGIAATAALVFALRRIRGRRPRRSARSTVAFYDRLLRALARRGIEKRPDETATDFARRAGMSLPALSEGAIAAATRAFEGVRYAGRALPEPERAAAWLAAVRGAPRGRLRPGWTSGGA